MINLLIEIDPEFRMKGEEQTQSTFDFERVTFDRALGEARKQEGIAQAAAAHESVLMIARRFALRIVDEHGEVTADDVQKALLLAGYRPLGNAAGALFRGPEWVQTGELRRSARVSNHGHRNPVWRRR
jgi:hypothetical protein